MAGRGGRGWIHATTEGAPGIFVAIFRERKPPNSGRWHLIAYFRVVVPDMPAEDKAAGSYQLAVERIATELARHLGTGRDDRYQAWLNYLSGSDKNSQRPADSQQS